MSSMNIEVLYIDGCAQYESFAAHLEHLLHKHGVDSHLRHVLVRTNQEAEQLRFLGSPTLRMNGVDVDPAAAQRTDYGIQCRLYPTDLGYRSTPPDEWILAEAERARVLDK